MAKKKLTEEEQAAIVLANELKYLKERDYIPEPPIHISFKVGERVQYGAVKQSIVTEILDGGKIYKLHQIVTNNNYGRPFDSERDVYTAWYNIAPYRTIEENKKITQFSEEDTLRLNFSQRDIRSLFTTVYSFGLDMNPDYQRGNVWDYEDKVKLIESIFSNIDIGKFVFVHLPFKSNSPSYEVLDGKQRINAITEFYECRFKYKGFYFNDLCIRDQSRFESHGISVATLEYEQVKTSDKYKYFLRLNTGGKPQDPKHLEEVKRLYEKAIREGK